MIREAPESDRPVEPPAALTTRKRTRAIAHDLNNLLQIISGNAELMTFDLRPNDPQHQFATAIADAARDAAGLTRQLLSCARELEDESNQRSFNCIDCRTCRKTP
jgi:signal transduction histidine kinase